MNIASNNRFLNCGLSRYLKDASTGNGGTEAEFAAALLADLGYYDRQNRQVDITNIESLLEIFASGGHTHSLSKMKGHCVGCDDRMLCPVGDVILQR